MQVPSVAASEEDFRKSVQVSTVIYPRSALLLAPRAVFKHILISH